MSLTSTATEVASETRRGYRVEVLAWMKSEGIKTQAVAAKRVGVSETTLKSIMTTTGKTRYGDEALARVLNAIGYHEKR